MLEIISKVNNLRGIVTEIRRDDPANPRAVVWWYKAGRAHSEKYVQRLDFLENLARRGAVAIYGRI